MNMKKKIISLILLLFIQKVAIASGTTSYNFLKLNLGAKALAMGEAFVGDSSGDLSIFYNKAGLCKLNKISFSFTHHSWFQDINIESASFLYPFSENNGFGLGINCIDYGKIAAYDIDDNRVENVTADDLCIDIGYVHNIGSIFSKDFLCFSGIGIKYIKETLQRHTASSFAVDIGILIPSEYFSLGLSCQNLGNGAEFIEERFELPFQLKAGISTPFIIRKDFTFNCDYVYCPKGENAVNIGMEYIFSNVLALRSGYVFKDIPGDRFRVGFGFLSKYVYFDYAYVPFGVLGNSHIISLTFNFPKRERVLTKKKRKIISYKLLNKAQKALKKKRFKRAIFYLKKAIDLFPENTQAKTLLERTKDIVEIIKKK